MRKFLLLLSTLVAAYASTVHAMDFRPERQKLKEFQWSRQGKTCSHVPCLHKIFESQLKKNADREQENFLRYLEKNRFRSFSTGLSLPYTSFVPLQKDIEKQAEAARNINTAGMGGVGGFTNWTHRFQDDIQEKSPVEMGTDLFRHAMHELENKGLTRGSAGRVFGALALLSWQHKSRMRSCDSDK